MAKWDKATLWPGLRQLNGGQQYTDSSTVTPEVFNAIVNALIAAKEGTATTVHKITIKSNYSLYDGEGNSLVSVYYKIDDKGWREIPSRTTLELAGEQVCFLIYVFRPLERAVRVQCEELNLDISRSSVGQTFTDTYTLRRDINVRVANN